MAIMMKRTTVVLAPLLVIAVMSPAQTQGRRSTLVVQGCPAETPIVQVQGHALVDVQDLARITKGSLSFEQNRTILTLPGCDAPKTSGDDSRKSGFSPAFTKAGIEAMASIREWGGMLMISVENGYPVGNTMAGNTIKASEGRASDNVGLASSAASTDSDYRGLELLKNEFNNVQGWSDRYMKARNSLSAANLSISESALKMDKEVQKMIQCGESLAQMFAGGTFQDEVACR